MDETPGPHAARCAICGHPVRDDEPHAIDAFGNVVHTACLDDVSEPVD